MARPYRDAVEVCTEPLPERDSPFSPKGAVIVRGIFTPGVPDAAPLVLSPEYEYRLTCVPAPGHEDDPPNPETWVWVIERRRAARPATPKTKGNASEKKG